MNGDDPIIALEAENLLKKKGSLEKKKKDDENRRKQIQTGKTVLRNKGNNTDDWNMTDMKAMLKYKDPTIAVTSKKYKDRSDYEALWKKVKNKTAPTIIKSKQWTEKDAKEYDDLLSDGKKDISTLYIMRRAEERKMFSYVEQLKAIKLSENRIKTLSSSLQTLDKSERLEVLNNWMNHSIDDDYELSETSSISSVEEDRGRRGRGHVQQQKDLYIIEVSSDENSIHSSEEEEEEKEGDNVWNSD